jgi:predicted aspartyl protease
MRHALTVFAALAAGCSHPAPPAAPPAAPALPSVFSAFRDATGGSAWDRAQAIESHSTASIGGMTGTNDLLEDVATGRNRATIAVGPFTQTECWDGEAAWERAAGGEISKLDAPPAIALAKTNAWLTRRGYFRAGSAAYKDLGSHDGLHGIEATPEGGAPAALWFDDHGLLARIVEQQGGETVTTGLSDYRAVGDVKIPFHITIDPGDPRNKLTLVITDARLVPAPAAAAFASPKLDTERISFAGGAHETQIPFELINNHIYIHAAIDGQPVRVIVDTGGLNMLTPASAKRLGIATQGTMAAAGAGADKTDLGFGRGKRITIGDVTLADPLFYVIDVGKLGDVEGEDFDGLVGHELFSRVRVRIDYPARVLTLTAPVAFAPPTGAIAVPFVMADRIPIVSGSIDGVAGRFWVDTGSRSSLTTAVKFTKDNGLVAKYKPPFETVTGWGVGGATRASPVRFHDVKIGDAVVHDVVGDLFSGDKGAFADPDAAANLGGGILHRFIVTFDYAAKIMYLEPAKGAETRETYDRSGLFLRRDGDAFAVVAIVPHGPAEVAGIRVDDRITAIDGTPVQRRSLAAWREYLRGAPGKTLRIHVERAGDVTVTLAELVP